MQTLDAKRLCIRDWQSGVYAIEFALAFVVGFVVLYAILTYGLIFMAQQSMNRAANTGARALLAWSADTDSRVAAANEKITGHIDWIMQMVGSGSLKIAVCLPTSPHATQADPAGLCPTAGTGDSQPAQVIVRYDYKKSPLIPRLGIPPCRGLAFCLPVPAVLQAQARVDLGIVYPGIPEGS